jgi:hypothetical protein
MCEKHLNHTHSEYGILTFLSKKENMESINRKVIKKLERYLKNRFRDIYNQKNKGIHRIEILQILLKLDLFTHKSCCILCRFDWNLPWSILS